MRLLVLFVTAFVDMVGLAMVLPLLPFYATRFGASATVVGILISAFSLAQLVMAPLWGRTSDRRGRRPVIVAGLLVTAVGYVLFATADTVILLLASRIVQGLGGGTIGVVQAYVADVSPPERRTKSLGWLSAVTSLGAVLGPAIGSVLVRVGGQALPGWAAAGFAVLVAAFGWAFLRESRDAMSQTTEHPTPGREALVRVVTHWREPAPRLIWTYSIGIGAFYGIIPLVPLLLHSRLGVTEATIGYFIMYLGGMGVLMRTFVLGPLVDRLGEPRLSRWGIILLASGLAATAVGSGWVLIGLGFTLMPIGTACLFPAVTSLLSQTVRRSERGLYLGLQQTYGGLTRVAFPILGGATMDAIGVGTPFALGAMLLLLALPLTKTREASP
ncbi:MAG TPA: MFS transporter [Gemmatimonadales bacterium]|nr:MFS transporter [Gemmatimonadales bacterium]